jgi:hypothetical protein
VERVAVEAIPDRPSRRPPLREVPMPTEAEATVAQTPQPQIIRVPPDASAMLNAAFRAIARVLAVRFQLLLSLIGAFVLAIMAMMSQAPASLYVLIAFCVLITGPLVWLEFSGRPRG